MIVNGADLVADRLGGVFWPERSTLFVADLHFEKGSALAARGAMLPPYDTAATLTALEALIARHAPQRVVCLGDSFHDAGAPARLGEQEVSRITTLTRSRDWIWIAGNHDPEPPEWVGGEVRTELALPPLLLRHAPRAGATPGEVAGHLHPKAAVRVRGRRMVRRCFATDGVRLILPALGAYTGGLDVLDRAFDGLFRGAFHAYLLGREAVHVVPSARLSVV